MFRLKLMLAIGAISLLGFGPLLLVVGINNGSSALELKAVAIMVFGVILLTLYRASKKKLTETSVKPTQSE